MKQVYDYYKAETERIKNHIKENYTGPDDVVDQDVLYEEFYDFYARDLLKLKLKLNNM